MATPEAEQAIETLCRLAARAPADLVDWHYDEVDAALLDGRVDAAAAWPGGWGAIRDVAARRPARAPSAIRPARPDASRTRVATRGRIPTHLRRPRRRGRRSLTRLLGAELQARRRGGRKHVRAPRRARGGRAARATSTGAASRSPAQMIDDAMITYPPLARFPEIEDAGWSAIRDALRGLHSPAAAAARDPVRGRTGPRMTRCARPMRLQDEVVTPGAATTPPSTRMSVPVMNDAAGLTRNSTARGDVVRRADPTGARHLDHASHHVAEGAGELGLAHRGGDDPRTDRHHAPAAATPRNRRGLDAHVVRPLRDAVGNPGSIVAGSSTGNAWSSSVGVVASTRRTSGVSVVIVPAMLAIHTATVPGPTCGSNASSTRAVPITSTSTICREVAWTGDTPAV